MSDEPLIGRWVGPFDGQLADGRTVSRGQEAPVTLADLESGHWEAISTPEASPEPAQPSTPTASTFTTSPATTITPVAPAPPADQPAQAGA